MAFIHRTSSGDTIICFSDDEIKKMEVRLDSREEFSLTDEKN